MNPFSTFTTIDAPASFGPCSFIGVVGTDSAGDAIGYCGFEDDDGDISEQGFVYDGYIVTSLDFLSFESENVYVAGCTSYGLVYGSFDTGNATYGFTYGLTNYTTNTIQFYLSDFTYVLGVAPLGEVYGTYIASWDGNHHGFVDAKAGFSFVDVPGATYTAVAGMTASGEIVGNFGQGVASAGFIDVNGAFSTIQIAGASATGVLGVTPNGEIFGNYTDASKNGHGYLDIGGAIATFDMPDAVSTTILGFDGEGAFAGEWVDALGVTHGFVDDLGVVRSIDAPGAVSTEVQGIDSSGQIYGAYSDAAGPHGFVATLFSTAAAPVRIYGDANANTLTGGGGDDIIYGNGGADTITDGDGNATVIGSGSITLGDGNNFVELLDGFASSVNLGNGSNVVYGGSVGSEITFGTGSNRFYASSGADAVKIAAGSGSQYFYGDGQSTLDYSSEASGIVAYLLWDYVAHDGAADYAAGVKSIVGTNFGDRIEGAATTQSIVDGNGNNIIYGGGATRIAAGAGNNTIVAQASSGSVAVVVGGGSNLILGDAADDTISLGDGANVVYAGSGHNTVDFGAGSNRLYASSGVDDVVFAASSAGCLVYGDGATILDYSAETSGIIAYLDGDYVGHNGAGDYAAGIAKIVGTNSGDRIYGSPTTATIVDGAGSDVIYGGAATSIAAGAGDNSIIVQTSALATASAGDGANFIEDFAGSANIALGNGNNTILLGSGTYDLTLGSGVNHVESSGATTLHLRSGAANVYATNATLDYSHATSGLYVDLAQNLVIVGGQQSYVTGVTELVGSNDGDRIYAGAGDVTIDAGSGNNVIYAGTGDQTIVGGAGADRIVDGSAGRDVMTGGGGADQFYFSSDAKASKGTLDAITDFVSGTDLLKLQGSGFDNLAVGSAPKLYDLTSAADAAYATFAATADAFAFAFDQATQTLMFNDAGQNRIVSLAQLAGVTTLAAGDVTVY